MKHKRHLIFSYPTRIKIIECLLKGDGIPTKDFYSILGLCSTRVHEELSALESIGIIDRAVTFDGNRRAPDLIFINADLYERAKDSFIRSLP